MIAVLVFVAAWRYRPARGAGGAATWSGWPPPSRGPSWPRPIIGGIVVLTKLNPGWVSVHYLASAALVAATVALYVRCQEGTGPARPLVRPEVRLISLAVIGAVALMLAAGHGGHRDRPAGRAPGRCPGTRCR